jgi:hypothetical protein
MSTDNRAAIGAAAEVAAARAKLDELVNVERALEAKLPEARAALQAAEKRLRELTKPTRAAIRNAELETLKRKLAEATQNE